jgi:hypothetical protein
MHFDLEPKVDLAGPLFDESVRALGTNEPFVYAKLNHGFWERLVRIERLGYNVDAIGEAQAREIERRLNIAGSALLETGFLAELFALLASLPAPSEGFHFAATVDAWPHSYGIEGTPLENRAACLKAIEARIPFAHLQEAQRREMTGYEFKAALIAGRFHEFSRPLATSPFLLIANPAMAAFPAFIGAREADHLQVDARNARRDRHEILNEALTRIDVPREGKFDGFPLVTDAGICGVAMFVSDPLGQNEDFVQGQELEIIRTEPDDVVERLLPYCSDPARLRDMSVRGQRRISQLRNKEEKLAAKAAILRTLMMAKR